MIGYKVFNPDFTCNGFQFELGKTYIHEGPIKLCESGFHFCLKAADCFNYYSFDNNNIVCQVECENVSEEIKEDSKRVCAKITILRQLNWHEVLDLVNTGNYNSGFSNTGNHNSGHFNSGHYNSGNHNSGNGNSGHYNSRHYNSGNSNSGHYNSGHYNSGNSNSGNLNSGNNSSGVFCTEKLPTIKIFDKESNLTLEEFNLKYSYIYSCYKNQTEWDSLSSSKKEQILNMPNFDKEKFEEIMGIKILLQ